MMISFEISTTMLLKLFENVEVLAKIRLVVEAPFPLCRKVVPKDISMKNFSA